jgi:hypothetical protein
MRDLESLGVKAKVFSRCQSAVGDIISKVKEMVNVRFFVNGKKAGKEWMEGTYWERIIKGKVIK